MTKNLNPFYEGLMDDLSRDLETRYLELLKAKPQTWVHQNLIFDLEKLDAYYRCAGCRSRKPAAFCCKGYDVELTRHDQETVARHLPAVLKAYPELGRALADGWWRTGDTFEPLIRRRKNEDCLFLMPGGRGCYLHAFALDHGLDPLEVKPYICSLYPVVVIVIEDEVVITTFSNESRAVLESGERAVSCIQKRGPADAHALLQSRPILERMFGAKVIQRLIEQVTKSGRLLPQKK